MSTTTDNVPTPIRPEDVKVGMVVERRKGHARYRDWVTDTLLGDPHDPRLLGTDDGEDIWWPHAADVGWSLWLVEDAPEPVDPDADLIDAMARDWVDREYARGWDGVDDEERDWGRSEARSTVKWLREAGYSVTREATS